MRQRTTESRHERRKRFLLVTSLAERKGFDPVQGLLFLLALAIPIAVAGVFFNLNHFFVQVGAAVVALPLALAISINAEKLIAGRVIRRLRRVGHGLDVDRYLALLSNQHQHARLVVRLRFAEPWPSERMSSTLDATREWVPTLETVRFDGDHILYLQSKELATTEHLQAQYSSSDAFTNWPLHACFTAILRRVVPVLDAAHRIDHIEVDVDGKIESRDEPR